VIAVRCAGPGSTVVVVDVNCCLRLVRASIPGDEC
jgi:hypothetical protein